MHNCLLQLRNSECLGNLRSFAASFLADGFVADKDLINDILRHNLAYSGGTEVLPLGERGGVPAAAGQVELGSALAELQPELAKQVLEPTGLLYPPHRRPLKLMRTYSYLHSSYAAFVRRCVGAGMQELRVRKRIAKHRGLPVVGGGICCKKGPR